MMTSTLKQNKNQQNDAIVSKGRKKFSFLTEVRKNVANFKQQRDGEWCHIPDRKIVARMTHDLINHVLWVKGREIEFNWTLRELVQYISILPTPQEKDIPSSTKLKGIPVFYMEPNKNRKPMYNCPGPYNPPQFVSSKEMVQKYKEQERLHKDLELHHPDGEMFLPTFEASFECVLDVFNSLLRTYNISAAYSKLLDLLVSSKFSNLLPAAAYAALMHLHIRGVASANLIKESARWRFRSQEQLFALHKVYLAGKRDAILEAQYLSELTLHRVSVEMELRRARIGGTHDWSKFTKRSVHWYTWYWGIYMNFTPVNKHRADTGLDTSIEEFMEGRETMFASVSHKSGMSFAKGVADSPELQETIAGIKPLIEDAMKDSTKVIRTEIQEAIHQEGSRLLDEARSLVSEVSDKAEAVSTESLDRASTLIEKLTSSIDSVGGVIDSIKKIAGTFLQTCIGSFRGLPGMENIDISLDSIMGAIRDYILYQNVDSPVLRGLLVISIINRFGMFKVGYKYFTMLYDIIKSAFLKSGTATIDGEEAPAQETGFMDYISSSLPNLINVFSGVIASVAKGAVLTSTEFWSLVKSLAGHLRDFHFIGGGLLGISRIFDFVSKVYTKVSEWISVHIFKRTPEKEKIARRVLLWSVKVRYFASEAGLNSIRMNQKMKDIASALFSEFLALSAQCRENSEYRIMLNDVERHKRDVQNIYDYIVRLDAVSNFCPTMFHIQFVGEPGVGKSFLTKTFVRNIQSSIWPDIKGDSMYSFNPNLEFFDGYAGQKIFLIDDCFRMQEPKHLTTLIGLVTNTPVILPMANLTDKGTQLTSEVLVSSTNTAWPIGKDVLCMEAVHRRRHMLVQVEIDQDVRDSSTGQFSMPLYLKKYREEDLPKNPHLKFNLLRPVPRDIGSGNIQSQSCDEFTELMAYADKLKQANIKIQTPGAENLDPTFYFSPNNLPPEPLSLPCMGWTYEQLVHNFVVRYRAFRGTEQTYSEQRKYAHAEFAIAELEALFAQRDEIISPEAVHLPTETPNGERFKLIEKWFTDVHHPYGVTDPLGEKIASSRDSGCETLAQELDEVDFEKMVDDILHEGQETGKRTAVGCQASVSTAFTTLCAPSTSTGTLPTIEDERKRLQAIYARIRQQRFDPEFNGASPLRLRLKVMRMTSDGKERALIPLHSHYTSWSGWGLEPRGSWFQTLNRTWEVDQMRAVYNEVLGRLGCFDRTKEFKILSHKWRFDNEMLKLIYGANSYYPDIELFNGLRKKKSTFPIFFLQRLSYLEGRWCLDISDLDISDPQMLAFASKIQVRHDDGKIYELEPDIAFVLSLSDMFRTFVTEFMKLSYEQQEALVEDARWRNMYTTLPTLESVRLSCTSIIKRVSLRALEILLSPVHYLFHRLPMLAKWIAQGSLFFAVIWLLRSVASMIMGTHETSRVLHRGPQSNVIYHGRQTASDSHELMRRYTESVLRSNVREIRFYDSSYGCTCQGLLSDGHLFFNKHAIRGLKDEQVTVSISLPGGPDSHNIIVPRANFITRENADLAVLFSRHLPQGKSMRSKLLTEAEYDRADFTGMMYILSRFQNEPIIESHQFSRKALKPRLRTPEGDESVMDRAIVVSGNTVVGKSGSAVLYLNNHAEPKLLGIQAWAVGMKYNPEIAIQVVTQETFDSLVEATKDLRGTSVTRLAEPELPEPEILPAVFTSRDFNQVCGEVPERESAGMIARSLFKTSPIAPSMKEDGYESERCPAALSRYDNRLIGKDHPLKHSIGKYFRGTLQAFDPKILNSAKSALSSWITSKLDKQAFKRLSPYEIITGTREDGSAPMNLSSSPGIPFIFDKKLKGKKDFFEINEEGEVSHFDQETFMEYRRFLSCLEQKQLPLVRAYDFPKDELRPISKALGTPTSPPKTRSVTCLNMFHIMAWREVTLDFWAAMHRAADGTFPFCPGINPEGPEWSSAYHYLNKHPHAVDFDVSNWDGFLPGELLYASGDIVIEAACLDQQSANVVETILYDVANCYIQYGRILYQKSRGMVSGFPGTAEMNTLAHWLLIIYIYLNLSKNRIKYHSVAAFKYHVSCLIYGDDILLTFSDEISDWFNGETIASQYLEIGYPVTSADKSGVILRRKDLLKCQFLKSTWSCLGSEIYIRKMDDSVAYDLLYWLRAKEHPLDQFLSNSVDALRIMFGHGRRKFNEFVKRVNRWLGQAKLEPLLYTYDDLLNDHFNRYYSISYLPDKYSRVVRGDAQFVERTRTISETLEYMSGMQASASFI